VTGSPADALFFSVAKARPTPDSFIYSHFLLLFFLRSSASRSSRSSSALLLFFFSFSFRTHRRSSAWQRVRPATHAAAAVAPHGFPRPSRKSRARLLVIRARTCQGHTTSSFTFSKTDFPRTARPTDWPTRHRRKPCPALLLSLLPARSFFVCPPSRSSPLRPPVIRSVPPTATTTALCPFVAPRTPIHWLIKFDPLVPSPRRLP